MSAFKANLNRQQDRIRIFEEGVVFSQYNSGVIESVRVGGLVFGDVTPLSWRDSKISDFFSVKSDIEGLLNETDCKISWQPLTDCKYMHPGRSASIFIDGELVGQCGVIHPDVMQLMSIKGSAPIVFELYWDKIPKRRVPTFSSLSKYPSISRDLAFIVNKSCPSSKLLNLVKEEAAHLLKDIRIFDVYEGDKLEINKKSIAINLILQDSSQTLKEDSINFAIASILKRLKEEAGAELRE
jgi:phenylalanyl-tRNA synthetase beta chain